jgi:Rrf2 family protein
MATIELARHDRSIPLQAKAIAKQQGIPTRFIEQILQGLKQAGIVRSLRGAQGGYTLAQDPSQISLAELVNSMNGNEAMPSTANSSTGPIGNQGASSTILSTIWAQVQEAEQAVLRVISLQSLVEQQEKLESQRSLMYHI